MDAAIASLNGAEVDGRQIAVNRAQPQGGAAGGERPPDWPCPKCNASCFASRRECFKCGEPRPGGRDSNGEFDGAGGANWRESARRGEEKQSATGDVSGVSGYNVQGGGNTSRGRGGEKYNASARRNMEKTVAEEAAEDDDSRMAAYLARKRAREQSRGGR